MIKAAATATWRRRRLSSAWRAGSGQASDFGRAHGDWAGEARHVRDIAPVGEAEFAATLDTCRSLIRDRFGADDDRGAAAILLDDRAIVTGTAPEALNSSVQACHEIDSYCAAFRLGRSVLVSVCPYRESGRRTLVLSPRGVCRERLAADGPSVLVAVADLSEEVREAWMCSETIGVTSLAQITALFQPRSSHARVRARVRARVDEDYRLDPATHPRIPHGVVVRGSWAVFVLPWHPSSTAGLASLAK